MHAEGVTLIELLVTLAVIAVVLAVGVPAFGAFTATSRMAGSVNGFVGALHLARSEALKRRLPVTLCAASDSAAPEPACDAGAGPGAGWLVFVDLNADARRDAGELLVAAGGALPEEIAARTRWDNGGGGPPFYVAYADDGFRTTELPGAGVPPAGHVQFCDARGDADMGGGIAAGRWVRIPVAARPQVEDRRSRVQSADNPLGGC